MKQVVFAVFLMTMASLTGCLNEEDSSDTTEDNTDTKDDGLIDPVGQIPEESSIFIDSHGESGEWDCNGDGEDRVCNYVYYNKDAFVSYFHKNGTLNGIYYTDSDGIENSIDFNGWVNKTGNTVTIEGLKYPDRGPIVDIYTEWYYDDDGNMRTYEVTHYIHDLANKWLSNTCNNQSTCQIVFYGHNGLTYNGWFTLSDSTSWNFHFDADGDGNTDTYYAMAEYAQHTVTFDLPFEPYAFSIMNGYQLEQQYRSVDRIF